MTLLKWPLRMIQWAEQALVTWEDRQTMHAQEAGFKELAGLMAVRFEKCAELARRLPNTVEEVAYTAALYGFDFDRLNALLFDPALRGVVTLDMLDFCARYSRQFHGAEYAHLFRYWEQQRRAWQTPPPRKPTQAGQVALALAEYIQRTWMNRRRI